MKIVQNFDPTPIEEALVLGRVFEYLEPLLSGAWFEAEGAALDIRSILWELIEDKIK
jgi:hypothetical protein